jgi:hypothetical protein
MPSQVITISLRQFGNVHSSFRIRYSLASQSWPRFYGPQAAGQAVPDCGISEGDVDRRTFAGIERFLRQSGLVIEPVEVAAGACRDPADLHVLGLAEAGRAEYLITGDDDLLALKGSGRCRIVAPRRFWSLMHEAK